MTAQSQVLKLYNSVIDDVINNVKEAFMDEGVDTSVLTELKQIWQSKLAASKVMEPESLQEDSMIAGPYVALQQQRPGPSREQQILTNRTVVAPAAAPMYTTLSHPGQELSDAASMAYSSLLQAGTVLPTGAMLTPQPAHTGPVGSRPQYMAAPGQPQYLFAPHGSVGPVIIPHSQAVRLQQQGTRGHVPQVDGAVDDPKTLCEIPNKNEDEFSPALDPNFDFKSFRKSLDVTNPHELSSSKALSKSDKQMLASQNSRISGAVNNIPREISTANSASLSNTLLTKGQSARLELPSGKSLCGRVLKKCGSKASSTAGGSQDNSVTSIDSSAALNSVVTKSDNTCAASDAIAPASAVESATAAAESTSNTSATASAASNSNASAAPKRRSRKPKVEIIFQVDGANNSSSDDDDDDDDDINDDDDDSDKDPDDEDIPGIEDEPLNSGDDVSDNDPEELFDTENVVVCQYEKISRVRNKWRFYLKDGIMNIQGKDYVFLKASGEAEW